MMPVRYIGRLDAGHRGRFDYICWMLLRSANYCFLNTVSCKDGSFFDIDCLRRSRSIDLPYLMLMYSSVQRTRHAAQLWRDSFAVGISNCSLSKTSPAVS